MRGTVHVVECAAFFDQFKFIAFMFLPSLLSSTKADWFGNIRRDVLAGLVVALALIPEAIAFSIIAGWTPGLDSTPPSVLPW